MPLFVETVVEPTLNETVGHCPDRPATGPLSWTGGGAVAASCVTVYVRPAAVMCAVRAAPVFWAAAIVIMAVALPLAPEGIVSQDASDLADHAQPVTVLS